MGQFKQQMSLKQSLQFSLSLEMKMSCELLQLNAIELKEYLEKELMDNPLYEVEYKGFFCSDSKSDIIDQKKSLQDEIRVQIKSDSDIYYYIELILNNCDKNGYLVCNISEIAKSMSLDLKKLKQALNVLHDCIPYGIASKDLSECLCIQLKHLYPNEKIAYQLAKNYLNDLAHNYTDKLLKQLKCNREQLAQAIQLIQSCNPRPASDYDQIRNVYIKPDVLLVNENDKIEIQMIEYFTIKENKFDLNHFTNDEKKYIYDLKKQGRMIQNCIQRRQESLKAIMDILVNEQQSFLLHKGVLKTCLQKDLALKLRLHETTISRALKDKYFEFEGTIYPIKSLICKGIHDNSKAFYDSLLFDIIQSEDKTKPYSDEQLSKIMHQKGYDISRRTIAKYRDQMKIPVASKRKLKE